MNRMPGRTEQRGTVLVIGLVILTLLTVLAVTSMSTVATELHMARNAQNNETVFQAAESGLEQALALGPFDTSGPLEVVRTSDANRTLSVVVEFKETTLLPDNLSSLGEDSNIAAHHFVATATATLQGTGNSAGSPGISAVHHQGFYVPGPTEAENLSNNPIRTYWVQEGVQ